MAAKKRNKPIPEPKHGPEEQTGIQPEMKPVPLPDITVWLRRLAAHRHAYWIGVGFLFALMLVTYWPIVGTGLLSDDWDLSYQEFDPWKSIRGHWMSGGEGSYYRPLSRLFVYYQATIFGHGGAAQHIISILMFGWIGFWLAWGLRRLGHPAAGLVAVAVAWFHPVAVEPVGWISSQTDLLHMFFAAPTLAIAGTVVPTKKTLGISLALAFLTYLAKDTAIILGPMIVLGVAYVLLCVRPLPASRGMLFQFAGTHLALWTLYMFLRRVLLGSFLPSGNEVPIGQMSANVFAAVHEFSLPLVPLFPDRGFLDNRVFPVLVALLVFPVLTFVFAGARRHALAILTGLFVVAVFPYVQGMDRAANTQGGHRFFFHALWFFAPLVGLSIEAVFDAERLRRTGPLVALLAVLVTLRAVFLTTENIDHFQKASDIRGAMETELDALMADSENPYLITYRMPERIGGAFVFLNGFRSFLRTRYGEEIPFSQKVDLSQLHPGMDVYRISFRGYGKTPYIEYDERVTGFANTNTVKRDKPIEPVYFDLGGELDIPKLPHGPDMLFVERLDGMSALRYEIIGDDPMVTIPLPENFEPAGYKTITIDVDYRDATKPGVEETVEVIFLPDQFGGDAQSVSRQVRLKLGRQKIRFDVSSNAAWQLAPSIRWARFDPSTKYRGEIDLYDFTIE